MSRQYPSRDAAVRAWVRQAEPRGQVERLGGGWLRLTGLGTPRAIQGLDALAEHLDAAGVVTCVPARAPQAGAWAWQVEPAK